MTATAESESIQLAKYSATVWEMHPHVHNGIYSSLLGTKERPGHTVIKQSCVANTHRGTHPQRDLTRNPATPIYRCEWEGAEDFSILFLRFTRIVQNYLV